MANTYTLIASSTVGSGGTANFTFSSIPQIYTDLQILCSSKTNRGTFNNDAINLNLNGSTSNITAKRLFGDGSSVASNTGRGIINNAAASTSVFGNTQIYISNYTSANYKSILADSVSENNGTEAYTQLHTQLWSDTAAVTSIVLAVADGTLFLEHSTAYLYGIKNS
jgi:aspartate/tyrosine/aromatic aminotransferase